MQVQRVRVVSQECIASRIYRLTLTGSLVRAMHSPGQFVNVKVGEGTEFLLRRPISICEIHPDKEEFVLIYRAEGAGTARMSQLCAGDEVDILGPLGSGYRVESLEAGQTALLVGGGIGVPPLYELARQFHKRGVKTIHVLGFNREEDIFYEEEFQSLGDTFIATVDGSYGEAGYVTDVIRRFGFAYDKYYSCGPLPMLQALARMEKAHEGFVSLEERMACGVGACYACVCEKQSGEMSRVCYDGPVYRAEEMKWGVS